MGRRALLGGCLLAVAAGSATVFPDGATLLAAGPGGSASEVWAQWLTPALGRALPPGTPLHTETVGGADGVTAANQFDARTVPDGATALLLPGSAAMAWLMGDPRARFDLSRWVPTLAATAPGLVLGRAPVARLAGARLRVAAPAPAAAELPALLALDLLGANWTLVTASDPLAALQAGAVDAVCLHGRRVPEQVETLRAGGAVPLFTFGTADADGRRLRDPAFPQTPELSELLAATPDPALLRAWAATAAASALDVVMVLPQLTPAAMVALWRRAAMQALGSEELQSQAGALGLRPLAAPGAAASTSAVLADTAAQLALRRWLATRLHYRPA